MPIFDYKCEECGKEYEFMKFKSDSVNKCPECGATENQKQKLTKPAVLRIPTEGIPTTDAGLRNYVI